jgi:hypothetical protein
VDYNSRDSDSFRTPLRTPVRQQTEQREYLLGKRNLESKYLV